MESELQLYYRKKKKSGNTTIAKNSVFGFLLALCMNPVLFSCADPPKVSETFLTDPLDTKTDTMTMVLEEGFDNQVIIYMNDRLLLRGYFKTDISCSLASEFMSFNVGGAEENFLKITVDGSETELLLNRAYKICIIRREADMLKIIYTNNTPLYM